MVYVVSTCTEHGIPYLAVRALDGGAPVSSVEIRVMSPCHI